MKKIGKISIIALVAALLISSFAICISAEEPEKVVITEEQKAVLEYYEAGYFLNATFNDAVNLDQQASFDQDMFKDSSEEFKTIGKAAHKNNEDGTATIKSVDSVYFNVASGSATPFGINTKIKLDSSNSSVLLNFHSENRDSAGNETLKLIEITPNDIKVYKGTESGKAQYNTVNFAVKDSEFTIEFYISGGNPVMTIATENATQAITFNAFGFSFKSFDLGIQNVTVDYCEIYKGSFIRRLNDNTADIAAHINALAALYETNASKEGSIGYAEIVAKVLVNYGFYDASVAANAEKILAVVAPYYAETYSNTAATIDATKPYHECYNKLMNVMPYYDFIVTLSEIEHYNINLTEIVSGAKAVVDEEYARLEKTKEDTLISYAAIYAIPNIYDASYTVLESTAKILNEHPICSTYSDDTHSATSVSLAYSYGESVKTEYAKKDAIAKAFVSSVPIMCDENNNYADRYAAYVIAKENFFTDSSYNAYIENGTTIESLVDAYNSVYNEIKVIADYAEEFLLKMDEAKVTLSYAVRIKALDAAQLYIDKVEKAHPGVEEALNTYYVLRRDIDKKFEIARNYINAVLALKDAVTIEEKITQINLAKEYAALGADVSLEITDMEITVIEANIILSNESSKLALAQTHVNSYISMVNSIASKTTVTEKRAAITRALELKEGVDITANGVAEATMTLTEAIEMFNAEVNAANEIAAECNTLALDTVARTIPTAGIAQIVAILKKIYD